MVELLRKQAVINILLVGLVLPIGSVRASSWPMFQGNKEHTGYTAISLKPDQAEELWSQKVGPGRQLNPVTAADGKIFVTVYSRFNSGDQLFVLDTATGAIRWSTTFGSVSSVNPPSYADGNVYVQTGKGTSGLPYLHAFDAETGSIRFESTFGAQWERYYAPTIEDGIVYINGGTYGGMYAFNAYSGDRLWFARLAQYDQWTPVVGPDYVYAYVGGTLSALDKASGTAAYTISDPHFDWSGWSMNTVPVYGDDGMIYTVHDGRVMAFDTKSQTLLWENALSFKGQPSYSDGVVYVLNGSAVAAISASTGDVLWSWTPTSDSLSRNIIVTDSHLIVGSSSKTYLVDLKTHDEAWSYAQGGHISLADGVLYIASANGTLTAISLPYEWLHLDFPSQATENDGELPAVVSVVTPPASNLVVNLTSSDESEVGVPEKVTILAGQTNASFSLQVYDDALLDGSKTVGISAATDYEGYADGDGSLIVHDNESAVLTVSLPQTTYEGVGSVSGALQVNPAPDEDVAVSLLSDNPDKVKSGSVTIPAGQTIVPFSLEVNDNNVIDGIQTATITAEVQNWTSGQASMFIADNEMAVLNVQLPNEAMEGDGVLTNSGIVSVSGIAASDLQILLSSSDESEVSVPSSVTISAGESSVSFDVMVADDSETDGTQNISVTAQAPNYVPSADSMPVLDNDVHHLLIEGVSGDIPLLEETPITVSARTIDDLPVSTFTEPVAFSVIGDRGAITVMPNGATNFVDGTASALVTFGGIGNDATLQAEGDSVSGTSTVFNVTGSQIVITPASLTNVQVVAGETLTQTMVISNAGNADLEFDIQGLGGNDGNPDPLEEGLVAYYPFNGNADDESGNGYDGAVNGATLTLDRFGNPDAAYDFNGSSDFINCGNIINGFSNFTVSAWVNIDSFTDPYYMGPWSQREPAYSTGTGNYVFFSTTDSRVGFGTLMRWDDGAGIASRTGHLVPINEWHLITQTYDGNEVRQYDNGELVNSVETGAHVLSSPWDFLIGKTYAYPNYLLTAYFDGQIDDLRVYDRALSEQEVLDLVNAPNSAATVDLNAGLAAYYPFNGDAADASGNGHDGAVNGATLITNRFGDTDSAYYFDGVNDRIDMPSAVLDFERSDSYSQSFWMKTDDTDTGNTIIAKMQTSGAIRGLNVALNDGMLRVHLINYASTNNKIQVNGTSLVSDNHWHHVVVTYDGSSTAAGVKIYVDGNEDGTVAVFDSLSATILNSEMPTIGSRATVGFYMGALDDVRIYNRALSGAEIGALYSEADPAGANTLDVGLIASFPFSGDASDDSGNGHDGTVNGATLTTDRFGNADSAYHFDGNDYINMGDVLDREDGSWTYVAWIRSDNYDQKGTVINKGLTTYGTPAYSGVGLRILGGSRTEKTLDFLLIDDTDTRGNTEVPLVDLPVNEYVCVAGIYEKGASQDRVSLYVNGELVSSNAVALGYSDTNIPLAIGALYRGAYGALDAGFVGDIDDVRIYNRALSGAEIGALYSEADPAGTNTLDVGLIANYPFNGNANDESGNAPAGTVNGAILTTNRFGHPDSAYLLNGDSYLILHDGPSAVIGTNDFTYSMWVKTDSSSTQMLCQHYQEGDGPYWFRINDQRGKTTFTTYDSQYGHLWNSQSAVGVSDGTWHMLTCMREGNTTKVFMDDQQISSASGTVRNIVTQPGTLYVGAQRAPDNTFTYYFNGAVDDIRIYNRALSQTELEKLYALNENAMGADAPWLTADPATGTIPPGGVAEVPVTFNASGMVAGTVSNTTLLALCNDLLSVTNAIPVSMLVVETALQVDADTDGMADAWEQAYFGSATNCDPLVDTDGDGLSNLGEYIAGVCPTNGASRFMLQSATMEPSSTNGCFIVYWNAVTGRTYSVQWTPVIGDPFQPMATNLYYPCSSYTDAVHGVEEQGFYKVGVELQ